MIDGRLDKAKVDKLIHYRQEILNSGKAMCLHCDAVSLARYDEAWSRFMRFHGECSPVETALFYLIVNSRDDQ